MSSVKWTVTMTADLCRAFREECRGREHGPRSLVVGRRRMKVVTNESNLVTVSVFDASFFNDAAAEGGSYHVEGDLPSQAPAAAAPAADDGDEGVDEDAAPEFLFRVEVAYERLERFLRSVAAGEVLKLSLTVPERQLVVEVTEAATKTVVCAATLPITPQTLSSYEEGLRKEDYDTHATVTALDSFLFRAVAYGGSLQVGCRGGQLVLLAQEGGDEGVCVRRVAPQAAAGEVPLQAYKIRGQLERVLVGGVLAKDSGAVPRGDSDVCVRLAAGLPLALSRGRTTCYATSTEKPRAPTPTPPPPPFCGTATKIKKSAKCAPPPSQHEAMLEELQSSHFRSKARQAMPQPQPSPAMATYDYSQAATSSFFDDVCDRKK